MNVDEAVEEVERNMYISRRVKDKVDRLIKNKNIKPQKIATLVDLEFFGKSKLKDIAERTGASPQALCIMYNGLEKENLIKRETDKKDRRNTYYSISKSGINFLEEHIKIIKSIFTDILSKFNEDDIKEFGRALKTVNDIVEKRF